MPESEFQLPIAVDYVATFLWALSGAIVGMYKRYDFAGMLVIAVLASTGGSLIRDGLFLQRRPPLIQDGWYIPLILAASVVAALFRHRIGQMPLVDNLIGTIDAAGVPAFAVVGMQLSLRAGIPLPGVILIGAVNGFGGGLLRDLVVGDTPSILKPGQFALTPLIFVCVIFIVLVRGLGINKDVSAWSVIALFFAIRMLSVRFNWRTRSVLPRAPQ